MGEIMLSPKRVKYRKMQRGRMKGKVCRNNRLACERRLQARACVANFRQIEALEEQYHVTQNYQKLTILINL